jgi:peptidyl-prolyl cis-trans isomerase C
MLVGQSPVVAQEEKMDDPVVVSCNGTEYTKSQVLKEIDELAVEFSRQMNPQQKAQKNTLLFKPAIDRIISQQLIAKAAKDEKVEVKPETVQEKIDELASQFPSKELFEQQMLQRGMNMDTLKEIFHRQMQLEAVLAAKNGELKPPTDEEIKAFYDENASEFEQVEQVRASHILLKTEETTPADEKAKLKKQLEDIAKEIKDGKITFADAAKQHSQCPSAPQGGDLSFFGKGQMVEPFEAVAFSSPKGEISDIVETQFGYHLITVTDKKEAGKIDLAEVKDDIKDHLIQQKKRDAMEEFLQKSREEADVVMKISEAEWSQQQGENIPIQLDPNQ